MKYESSRCMVLCDRSFYMNSKVEIQRKSGIQSKFLDGGMALQTKGQELTGPRILHETTDRKVKEKKGR